MAQRDRPYAFMRIRTGWINLCMVTDIEDHGDELVVFLATSSARLAGRTEPEPVSVARRLSISDAGDIEKIKRWLLLNDED